MESWQSCSLVLNNSNNSENGIIDVNKIKQIGYIRDDFFKILSIDSFHVSRYF